MDSIKDFRRTRIPFHPPVPVLCQSREVLISDYGNISAVLGGGIVKIQTKKLKGDQREVIRINTNVSPTTIEFRIEVIES